MYVPNKNIYKTLQKVFTFLFLNILIIIIIIIIVSFFVCSMLSYV